MHTEQPKEHYDKSGITVCVGKDCPICLRAQLKEAQEDFQEERESTNRLHNRLKEYKDRAEAAEADALYKEGVIVAQRDVIEQIEAENKRLREEIKRIAILSNSIAALDAAEKALEDK